MISMVKLSKIFCVCFLLIFFISCAKGDKKIVAKYDDGKPFIVEYVKNNGGKSVKTYEEHYYPNGKKRLEGKFSENRKDGIWKFYYENGSLFAKTDFTDSKEGNSWLVYLNKDSLLVDKDDELQSIGFSTEGVPVSIKVKRRGQEIFYRFFNSFGIMERVFLKGNIPQGEAMSWYEDGSINSIHYYIDGMQDSSYIVYSQSGSKILSGQYRKGIKVGKWEYFSSEGKPLGYEIYDTDGTKLASVDNQGLKYSTEPSSRTKE